jgi:hypothetical protein
MRKVSVGELVCAVTFPWGPRLCGRPITLLFQAIWLLLLVSTIYFGGLGVPKRFFALVSVFILLGLWISSQLVRSENHHALRALGSTAIWFILLEAAHGFRGMVALVTLYHGAPIAFLDVAVLGITLASSATISFLAYCNIARKGR